MTPLKKEIHRRSTGNGVNRRQYIVTLAPGDVIGFRDLRTRKSYWTSLALCYQMAVHQQVAKERAERKRLRKNRGAAPSK